MPVAAAAWASAVGAVLVPDAAPVLALALWAVATLLLVVAVRAAAMDASIRRRRSRHRRRRARGRRGGRGGIARRARPACARPWSASWRSTAVGRSRSRRSSPARWSAGQAGTRGVRCDRDDDRHRRRHALRSTPPSSCRSSPRRSTIATALDVGAVGRDPRQRRAPARPGERAVLKVTASRGVTVIQPPTGIFAVAAGLRQGLVAAVEGLPEPGAGLVPGLAVGDTSAVGPQLDADMKESSLSHLTAVSGRELRTGRRARLPRRCSSRRTTEPAGRRRGGRAGGLRACSSRPSRACCGRR